MNNSYELLAFLKSQNLLDSTNDEFWWHNSGTFEVVIGAILTQNTNWRNVEKSLENLRARNLLSLENLAKCDIYALESYIMPSGFYRQKAQRLGLLAHNIIDEFGDFEGFKERATREWLLAQKGIGKESADSILNYALYREVMVVDKYTQRLLSALGVEFYDYDDIATWLVAGIVENYDKVVALYGYEISLSAVYARFHAKIVEFSKLHKDFKGIKL